MTVRGSSVLAFVVYLLASFSGAAATSGIPVRVRIRSAERAAIPTAYVGLVPKWRPLNRPLVERIAENGSASFRVPAGSYRLVAGASGYALTSTDVTVVAGSENAFAVDLRPLKRVAGNVRDSEGNAIPAARVRGLNAAAAPGLGYVSEMAVRHLSGDWSATTDESGSWSLALPEATVPLVFDAPGRATSLRSHRATGTATVDVVVLGVGATLHLLTDRTDPHLVVTLIRQDGQPVNGIAPGDQALIWARWVSTTSLTWDSLPPGEYAVYAKYHDPRFMMPKAMRLAAFAVLAGQQHELRVALPPAARPAETIASLLVEGLSAAEVREGLQTFGTDPTGGAAPAAHAVEEVLGGSVIHMRADALAPPFFAANADRFFSTTPDASGPRVDVEAGPWPAAVHPRADANLHLRSAEEGLQFPANGQALFRDCTKAVRVTVPVGIGRDNLARLTAPAGCRSVVLSFPPFEPVVLEKLLEAGDQSLGNFVLRAAGAVDVRVAREPGQAVVPGSTVRILAASDEHPDRATVTIAEATTGDDGWARFSGTAVHRNLRVVAETPAGEKSVAAELRLEPRGRGVVDPLVVPEPATMIVEARIDTAFASRFPAARVTTIVIHPLDPQRRPAERRQENLKEEVPLRFERLYPGRWKVAAIVSVAGQYSMIDLEELELKAGETRRIEATVEPNVFEGVVTSGGRGVAARVTVEDGDRRISFNSAENGVFQAVLQDPGVYDVTLARASAQSNVIPVGEVAFTDPGRRVEIAIPDGGQVTARVRAAGRAAPKVMVWAWQMNDRGQVEAATKSGRRTDARGEVAFDDLAPGVWTLSADDEERGFGAEKSVTVEPRRTATVELEIERNASIEGTVRDARGMPLPRAHLSCVYTSAAGTPATTEGYSNGEGRFSLRLVSPPPPAAFCTVIAPSGAIDAFRAIPGETDVRLPAAISALTIAGWAERGSDASFWLAAPDGRVINLASAAAMLGRFGAPLTLPAVAAGRWKLIRTDALPQWLALGSGLAGSLPAMADITLRPGAAETIQVSGVPAH
ncbi:MAG TPA: carboxypeptidase-like regulatory domain-containing protein [Thermoanaerobaculia bacterium]|jgi:hypothetical protein